MTKSQSLSLPKPTSKRYQKLVQDLRKLVMQTSKTGSQALNEVNLKTYWIMGDKLTHLEPAPRGFIFKLARDVTVTPTLLYRTHHFRTTWEDGLTDDAYRLEWSKHLLLAGLKPRKRDFYLALALKRGLSREQLAREIRNDTYSATMTTVMEPHLTRDPDPLHVYKARIESIIDGDTLTVLIDLGFGTFAKQNLRLRGINTSELATPDHPSNNAQRADKAKTFVVQRLQSLPFIVIKTHKTDIYGRFVADVFYHDRFTDKRDIATNGFFLNDELLHEGLADPTA